MKTSSSVGLFNESESISELNKKIESILSTSKLSYEILYVDDGSKDDSWKKIIDISKINPNTHGLRFLKNYGKSMALSAGFSESKGSMLAQYISRSFEKFVFEES